MKKIAILSVSMGALFLVGISVVTLSGINQLDTFPVKADPTGYSVTFDAESTVEAVGSNYAICETTENRNKVGVVGTNPSGDSYLDFHGTHLDELYLNNIDEALENVAFEFSHITGFAISFSSGQMKFESDKTSISSVTSGTKYDVSLTPSERPAFARKRKDVSVTISSLTIWYSC